MGVLDWLFGVKEESDYPQDWQDNPVAEETDEQDDYGYDDLVADVHGAMENIGPDLDIDIDGEAESDTAESDADTDSDADGDSDGDGEGGGDGGEK